MIRPKPVVLALVSGFGVSPAIAGNAVRTARCPVFLHLIETYPTVTLEASGAAVGLIDGARGSSRAGCRTIGAGRAVADAETRIADALANGTLMAVPALRRAFESARRTGGAVHLIGTVGVEGSHAHRMLTALLSGAHEKGIARAMIHAVLEGDEAHADPAASALAATEDAIRTAGVGTIGSVSGSSFTFDRDRKWDRIRLAYEAIAQGSPSHASWQGTLRLAESRGACGSACLPMSIGGERIRPGDTVLFFDQASAGIRECATAFALPAFTAFSRPFIANTLVVTIIETDPDLPIETAFAFPIIEGTLGEAVSSAGFRQLRVAETEGFVDVTEGLNGSAAVLPGEERVIIPSPVISRSERVPGMSSSAVADRVVKEIVHGRYDVIVMGLAAPGCIARTGDEAATVKACEAVDRALGRVVEATFALDGALLFVSDHGHAEALHDPTTGEVERIGTRNPVPFIVAGHAYEGLKARSGDIVGGDLALTAPGGTLADVAPTLLKILGIPKPKEMKGEVLV